MYNAVTLVGRLTRDAEVGLLPNDRRTPKLRFTLAVDRDYAVDGATPADFWPVEVLGEYGARLAPHLTRGRLVLVSGSAHIDERRDEAGQYRVFPYLSARQVRFLDPRPRPGDELAGDGDGA
jgi:single-stranded DNA-binding protein